MARARDRRSHGPKDLNHPNHKKYHPECEDCREESRAKRKREYSGDQRPRDRRSGPRRASNDRTTRSVGSNEEKIDHRSTEQIRVSEERKAYALSQIQSNQTQTADPRADMNRCRVDSDRFNHEIQAQTKNSFQGNPGPSNHVQPQVHPQGYDQVQTQGLGQVQSQGYGQVHPQWYGQVQTLSHGQVHPLGHGQVQNQGHGQAQTLMHGQAQALGQGQVQTQAFGQVQSQGHGQVHPLGHGRVHQEQPQRKVSFWGNSSAFEFNDPQANAFNQGLGHGTMGPQINNKNQEHPSSWGSSGSGPNQQQLRPQHQQQQQQRSGVDQSVLNMAFNQHSSSY